MSHASATALEDEIRLDSKLLNDLVVDSPVVVHSLENASLNGLHGVISGPRITSSGRFPVNVAPAGGHDYAATQKAIRLANLRPADTADEEEQIFFTPSDRDDAGVTRSADDGASAEPDDCCRICMDDDVTLIRPCACRGTLAWACGECTVRAAVAAWESGAREPMRCKQCLQEYTTSLRLAITREQLHVATSRANDTQRTDAERANWLMMSKQVEIELACAEPPLT
jgi:hypothetical protein